MKAKSENKNLKISLLPFFIRALIILLKKYPTFNSSLDQNSENLILKKYINIGIAVDTPNGLVVPVIKDVDKKSIKEISLELSNLSQKAREKKLLPTDLEGSCFTVSSLGGIGGTFFTPIINPPEVAILGISRSEHTPIYKNNKLQKRLILPYSLSYDHRVIDGAEAVKFTSEFGKLIENLNDII
jgi:pyruvate dehydrogenase E2 component (dihydrolipoamide acetyltransferase)